MSEFIVGARGHDFGRHSAEELLCSIGDAGFRCTQLAYTKAVEGVKSYADVTPALVDATNAAVQKSGVSIAVDGTYVELGYADEDKRRAEVAKALSQVPVAKALRAGCMGSETTNMAKQPTVSRKEAQEALLRSLGEIIPICEEQGVLFAVECVYYHSMNTPEAVRLVLDTIASPNLRVICDLANYVQPRGFLRGLQRRLRDAARPAPARPPRPAGGGCPGPRRQRYCVHEELFLKPRPRKALPLGELARKRLRGQGRCQTAFTLR